MRVLFFKIKFNIIFMILGNICIGVFVFGGEMFLLEEIVEIVILLL